ncbi:PREDICTED: uncharacterized protein LOC106811418 [Priapulus caudatus]|uniref:Uncharacterized protein LOC106811418 n=1 Tax=Priapulus caudatus TaxID=37621 RepID=A0ABM1EE87_PRICU|nr:PREDICTED: uncharacterized protein LOC106811418 [Priapulus caudatus]
MDQAMTRTIVQYQQRREVARQGIALASRYQGELIFSTGQVVPFADLNDTTWRQLGRLDVLYVEANESYRNLLEMVHQVSDADQITQQLTDFVQAVTDNLTELADKRRNVEFNLNEKELNIQELNVAQEERLASVTQAINGYDNKIRVIYNFLADVLVEVDVLENRTDDIRLMLDSKSLAAEALLERAETLSLNISNAFVDVEMAESAVYTLEGAASAVLSDIADAQETVAGYLQTTQLVQNQSQVALNRSNLVMATRLPPIDQLMAVTRQINQMSVDDDILLDAIVTSLNAVNDAQHIEQLSQQAIEEAQLTLQQVTIISEHISTVKFASRMVRSLNRDSQGTKTTIEQMIDEVQTIVQADNEERATARAAVGATERRRRRRAVSGRRQL